MTFDYGKLRGRIVEKYGTLQAFSKEMGFTPGYFAAIMKHGQAFKQSSILKMANALGINDEIGDYFFAEAVQVIEHNATKGEQR